MRAELAIGGNRPHIVQAISDRKWREARGLAAQLRERDVAPLSDFQAVSVNRSVNDEHKRALFPTFSEVTGHHR
jgi:xanthine dehydrogenase iron-sulfur cluster and FAD-binding subunit A